MARRKNMLAALVSTVLVLVALLQSGITVQAKTAGTSEDYSGGVAFILEPGNADTTQILNAIAKELNVELEEETVSTLVMANVKNSLNVRSEADEESERVGLLYKDCGGTILERKDGWTKLQSGNIIGWAKDEYLLFDEEAEQLADEVGRVTATVNTDALRVRMEPDSEAKVYTQVNQGAVLDVMDNDTVDDEWISVDYKGNEGYVSAEYVDVEFKIDAGETMEEIEAREAAERAAKKAAEEKAAKQKQEAERNVNYGEYASETDDTMLLAALIQCEAGGESYDGQLAVGAVVMNRVRSGAYPNSVHGVIFASGQFTPALNGDLTRLLDSGRVSQSCINAATDALAGNSNIGDKTHFRRNDGRDGIVIGNHVFY